METYKQIHDFTAQGAASFSHFLISSARESVNTELCRLECLGVIEERLNSAADCALTWELGELESVDGQRHTFTASDDDLIIEEVRPDE